MLAIVPVRGRDGKHRLGGFLSSEERARLVEAMLTDVVAACEKARSVTGILVVTPEPGLAPDGVDVLVDEGVGHPQAVERALAHGRAREGALVVMGDCPLATAEALDGLAAAADPVALAPATDGGMNAIALRPGDAILPALGLPDAADATLRRARQAGVDATVVEDPALAFDVDHPADVWKLREGERPSHARAALEAILPPTGGLL